jgi:hypothetical protein
MSAGFDKWLKENISGEIPPITYIVFDAIKQNPQWLFEDKKPRDYPEVEIEALKAEIERLNEEALQKFYEDCNEEERRGL